MTEQLWDSDWTDTNALLKAATAVPENFRVQDPSNPLAFLMPTVEDTLPLILNARNILEERGVNWRPQKPVERVNRPVETQEQQLDRILDRAAAKMTASRGRRR